MTNDTKNSADSLASAGGVEVADHYRQRWDLAVDSAKSWTLVDATRFKLNLNSRGRPNNTFPKELDGRWVVFQHAEDDAHVPLSLMLDQANAALSKEREVADGLRAELEAVKRDAERYRWLRDLADAPGQLKDTPMCVMTNEDGDIISMAGYYLTRVRLDEAIDEAMGD